MKTTNQRNRMQVALLLIAGLALTVAGCGGGGGTYLVQGSTTTPTTTKADFAFQSLTAGSSSSPQLLNTSGGTTTGSVTLTLQSVNGFTSPITFPVTTTVRDSSGATLSNFTATAAVTPTSVTLPAGNTNVTLQVTAPANLPAGATILVNLRATGGGLNRYPSKPGPYAADAATSSPIYFSLPFLTASGGSPVTIPALLNSQATLSAAFDHAGISGTATLTVTGLPAGITAAPTTMTVATGPLYGDSFSVPITVTGDVVPGFYPVNIVVTLNGVTYTSSQISLQVNGVAMN